MMDEFIHYTSENRIGTITIDRPAKKNAMTFAMLADFIATVEHAGLAGRDGVYPVSRLRAGPTRLGTKAMA